MDNHNGELVSQIALTSLLGIGPRTFERLVQRCGSASAVFATSYSSLSDVPRFSRSLFQEIQSIDLAVISEQVKRWKDQGVIITEKTSPNYPSCFLSLSDAPPLIYSNTVPLLLERPCIAIVGSRHASKAACFFTEHLAQKLAQEGMTIVSGMAAGIDRAAHLGALRSNGLTIAILGSGVLVPFPSTNEDIYRLIRRNGVLLSEQVPGFIANAGTLITRNRLIAALATLTVVIDAHRQGGTIETAMKTLKYDKKLMVYDSQASGNRFLLRQGAIPFHDVQDIVEQVIMEWS